MENVSKSSSEHQKLSKNHIDLLSKLPQPLLCHILSFLPTREVVATSILSKTWRFRWTLVPNLDIQETDLQEHSSISFADIVNTVLFHPKLCHIKKFSLKCSSNSKSFPNLDSWFCCAASQNIEELDLSIEEPSIEEQLVIVLPFRIFSCKTLVVLKLTGYNIFINVSFSFPRLKILHLVRVWYEDEESFCKIFSGCPVLEDLVVEVSCIDDIEFGYQISSTTLKRLRVEIKNETNGSHLLHNYTLKISAPSLEYLAIFDDVSKDYYFENLNNLVEANVDVHIAGDTPFSVGFYVIQAMRNAKFHKI